MKQNLKIAALTSLLFVILSFSAAAEGAQEVQDEKNTYRGPGSQQTLETIELSGTIHFGAAHPKIKTADGKEYTLLYPYFLADGIQISEGDSLSVEGAIVPGPRRSTEEGIPYLRVEKAVIDGKEYVIDGPRGPYQARRSCCPEYFRNEQGRRPGRSGFNGSGMYPPRQYDR